MSAHSNVQQGGLSTASPIRDGSDQEDSTGKLPDGVPFFLEFFTVLAAVDHPKTCLWTKSIV